MPRKRNMSIVVTNAEEFHGSSAPVCECVKRLQRSFFRALDAVDINNTKHVEKEEKAA